MADPSLHIPYGQLYLKFTPGTSYAYSGEGYHYLAQVIAHLNGGDLKTLNDVFEREEAEPLCMEHAWFTGNSYLSAHMATGHKNGKVAYKAWPTSFLGRIPRHWRSRRPAYRRDIVCPFLTALTAGKVLTRKSQSEMLRQQVEMPRNDAMYVPDGDTGYALGSAIRESRYGGLYEHGGNNGTFQSSFRHRYEKEDGVCFFTNRTRATHRTRSCLHSWSTGRNHGSRILIRWIWTLRRCHPASGIRDLKLPGSLPGSNRSEAKRCPLPTSGRSSVSFPAGVNGRSNLPIIPFCRNDALDSLNCPIPRNGLLVDMPGQ